MQSPKSTRINRRLFSTLALATTLTACGGGSSDSSAEGLLPKITAQPADASVIAGQGVTWTVAVLDETGVSYQWTRNGIDITGAVQKTLTLQNVALSDTGSAFAVRVSNAQGAVTSRTAILTVRPMDIAQAWTGLLPADFNLRAVDRYGSAYGFTFLEGKGLVVVKYNAKGALLAFGNGLTYAAIPQKAQIGRGGLGNMCIQLDSKGNIYASLLKAENWYINTHSATGGSITKITPAGDTSLLMYSERDDTLRAAPARLAIDGADNLYFVDVLSRLIRKISPAGDISKLAAYGPPTTGYSGTIYVTAANRWNDPAQLAVTPNGKVYFAADGAYRTEGAAIQGAWAGTCVKTINVDGSVSTFAGLEGTAGHADGDATTARFAGIQGLELDALGNLYFLHPQGDDYQRQLIRRITPSGSVTTWAGQRAAHGNSTTVGPLPGQLSGLTMNCMGQDQLMHLSQETYVVNSAVTTTQARFSITTTQR